MRAAMHRVACLPVTLDSEGRDPGGLDGQLRDAAVRDVHLEQPALNHGTDASAAPTDPCGSPLPERGDYHGGARSPGPR